MTQDEIIRMAREAGFGWQKQLTGSLYMFTTPENLERFAALVAAHEREKHGSPSWETVDDAIAAEREACAKVCEDIRYQMHTSDYYAAAIRARGDNGTA